jgi:hypothetical protein
MFMKVLLICVVFAFGVQALSLDQDQFDTLVHSNVIPVSKDAPHNYTLDLSIKNDESDELPAFQLKYEVMTVENLISLDHVSSVQSVSCYTDSIKIEFSNVQAVPQDNWVGKLLAGGLKWNCLSEVDEAPIAFYREITEVIASDLKTLTLATVKKDFTDCFVEANIKLRVEPARTDLKRDENIQFNRQWNVPWNVNFPNPRAHTIVQSGTAFQVTCPRCYFTSNVGVEFDIGITAFRLRQILPRLDRFMLRAFGNAELGVSLAAFAQFAVTNTRTITVVNGVNLPTLAFSIGPVPVTIVPRVALTVTGRLEAAGRADASITAIGTTNINMGVRFVRNNNRFEPFRQFNPPRFTVTNQQFSATGSATFRVTINPELTLRLWDTVPFVIQIRPYVGVNLLAGRQSLCTPQVNPFFSTHYGVDGLLRLDPIRLMGATWDLGGRLPWSLTPTLIARTDLTCARCRGCLPVVRKRAADEYFYWNVEDWTDCSNTCGQGVQTRPVSCVSNYGDVVSDSSCVAELRPDTNRTCVSTDGCGEARCPSLSSCGECLSSASCYWCGSSSSCVAVSASATCVDPRYTTCEVQPAIRITSPANQTSVANQVQIRWTGGASSARNGKVWLFISWDGDNWFNGAGLPTEAILNTGSYTWTIPSNIPARSMKIAVFSEDYADYAISEVTVSSKSLSDSPVVLYSAWSSCSQECGSGLKQRSIKCLSQDGTEMAEDICSMLASDLTFASCNTFPCDDFPITINKPLIGEMFHNGDTVNIEWTGGRVDSNVVVQYRYAIYTNDKDLDVEKDNINFREYAWSDWLNVVEPYGGSKDTPYIPNNGYLDWFLDNKIRGSWVYYQLRVISMNDPTNNDLSEVFVISKPIQLDISVHRRNALNALRGVRMTLHGMTGEQQGVTLTKDDLHEVVRVNNIGEILSVTLEVTDGSRTNGSNMVDSFVEIHSLTGIEQDVVTGFASQLAVQERFDCDNFESDCDSCTRVDDACGWCMTTRTCTIDPKLVGEDPTLATCPVEQVIMTPDQCQGGVASSAASVVASVFTMFFVVLSI